MHRGFTLRISLWYLIKLFFVSIRDLLELIGYICFIFLPDLLVNWWVESTIVSEYIEDYKAEIQDVKFRRRWGTFIVGISEKEIFTNEGDFALQEITLYHSSLGNSEPYAILSNVNRVSIETSWLNKLD